MYISAMQGQKTYREKFFVNFHLSERVPEGNFYRRLKSSLDLEYLRTLTKDYYGIEGQKSIDPVVFFKLMLVGSFWDEYEKSTLFSVRCVKD